MMSRLASISQNTTADIAGVVEAIEAEMRLLDLWTATPPSPAALSSAVPFCYDSLQLTEWLQWILVPRMKAILDQNAELPTASEIAPLAEEEFTGIDRDTDRLLELIRRFDRLIAQPPA